MSIFNYLITETTFENCKTNIEDLFIEKITDNQYSIIGTNDIIFLEEFDSYYNVVLNDSYVNKIYKVTNDFGIIKENTKYKYSDIRFAIQESLDVLI